ncbi:MAG: LysM peptidoglycan-binding domain-containing protein [Bacillus sp. (in: Bacteria)]|nr:LysM peptidoglycan-binding domain-containing protein [Bacillus sp. (in: firmicutes)]
MINLLWKKYSYVMILFIVSMIFGITMLFMTEDKDESFMIIVVNEGDTLWSLAEQYAEQHHMTKTQFIQWVQQKNELKTSSVIHAGNTLVIPVKATIDSSHHQFAYDSTQ